MKKLFVMILLLISFFSLCSCTTYDDRINRIDKICPDINYHYEAYGDEYISIDGKNYSFEKLAKDIIKKECDSYPYSKVITNDYIYFLYQYGSHGKVQDKNNKRFDISLFRVNLKNAECELLYDFKDVYPTYNYTYTREDVYCYLDDETLIFKVNGFIQVFDVVSKTILHSYEAYDKEKYRTCEFFPYKFNEYGDFFGLEDGDKENYDELRYFEYKNRDFVAHYFDVNEESFYVDRFEHYIYTSMYDNKRVYFDGFDLDTNERIDDNFLESIIEKNNNNSTDEENDFSFSSEGKQYYYDYDLNKDIQIFDAKMNQLYLINDEFIKTKNTKYEELMKAWSNDDYGKVNSIVPSNDKLFISFFCTYGWQAKSPNYIFELDIKSGNFYYVGYLCGSTGGLTFLNWEA